MKILTNIQTSYLAGIGQAFWVLVNNLEKEKKNNLKIVGIKILTDPNVVSRGVFTDQNPKNFSMVSLNGKNISDFKELISKAENIGQIKEGYRDLIQSYYEIIRKESPDLVLINGTYYVPWCLFLAASETKIPVVLHYHGILSKETSHWPEKQRNLMKDMERTFDNDRLFYLFPSMLARKTVEDEVFGHKINKSAVVPNPIADHFFKIRDIGSRKNIGFVGRWSKIKNPKFIKNLAKYNQNKNDLIINLVSEKLRAKKMIGEGIKNIRFIKPMDSSKLGNFYAKMGIILSPSYFETYGNVPQEAIASGTPALVNSNMGVAETFQSLGLKDWIINFDSVKTVSKKILETSGMEVPAKTREYLRQMVSGERISSQIYNILRNV